MEPFSPKLRTVWGLHVLPPIPQQAKKNTQTTTLFHKTQDFNLRKPTSPKQNLAKQVQVRPLPVLGHRPETGGLRSRV